MTELRGAPPIVLAPTVSGGTGERPPEPDEVWRLDGGTAWVYRAPGHQGLQAPVIMSDGFNSGPTSPEFLWAGLEFGRFRLLSGLRQAGKDVVLLGYDERSASILDNARTAREAIFRAVASRLGSEPLAVGGFSMGGLVTRYALAKMEHDGIDHQTSVYWSFDSPHRGAWIPLALQAFAHYVRNLDPRFSDQINSPAARQLLRWHLAEWDAAPGVAPERTAFLAELERVGRWPRRPRLLGLANGVGSGAGNGIQPGQVALEGKGLNILGTSLNTQPAGDDQLVAKLRVLLNGSREVSTSGLPAIDGAPGGTLEGFGILADRLNQLSAWAGLKVAAPIRSHCFVPSVSAVSVRDFDTEDDLYTIVDDIDPSYGDLDDFVLARENQLHAQVSEELGQWLLDRLG